MPLSALKHEIEQEAPFASAEEEALLNLVRTSDYLIRAMQHKIRPWGVTSTQYNVLRILRGAQPDGLTCSAIGHRMITAEPDITRLLARLKALRLIRQQQDRHDRRVVRTHISEAGLRLLKEMDPMVASSPQQLLGHMSANDLAALTRLLEQARQPCLKAHGAEKNSAPKTAGKPA